MFVYAAARDSGALCEDSVRMQLANRTWIVHVACFYLRSFRGDMSRCHLQPPHKLQSPRGVSEVLQQLLFDPSGEFAFKKLSVYDAIAGCPLAVIGPRDICLPILTLYFALQCCSPLVSLNFRISRPLMPALCNRLAYTTCLLPPWNEKKTTTT